MKTRFNILFVLLIPFIATGQEGEDIKHRKEKGIYELITSGIYSYSPVNTEGTFGSEVHFTYWFNHVWGAGFSYTHKFNDHDQVNEIAVLGSWNPFKWITLNVGPNILLPSSNLPIQFGIYSEAEINIRPKEWFHFGPVIGVVRNKHTELNLGVHLGFEF